MADENAKRDDVDLWLRRRERDLARRRELYRQRRNLMRQQAPELSMVRSDAIVKRATRNNSSLMQFVVVSNKDDEHSG